MSPWYQETPKGELGFWRTHRANALFLGMPFRVTSITCMPATVLMVTLARAFFRQVLSTADWERTILKEVLSTAKAAAANRAAISSAAPTASTTRLVVLFLLTFIFLSWLTFLFV